MAVASTSNTTSAQLLGITSYEEKKATSSSKGSEEMGKQDFLTLFTAQLKNQNPLDPVKNEAFVAQLAQFSQLEATTNMQQSLEKFVSAMSADRIMGSAALIGTRVPTGSGSASLAAGGSVDASIDLPDGASGVKVTIKDGAGRAVQELIAGAQNPGTVNFRWDGKDSTGAAAAAGTYQMTATAVVGGKNQSVAVQTLSTVRSVEADSAGEIQLIVDGGSKVALSSIKRFSQ